MDNTDPNSKHCVPCEGGALALTAEEVALRMKNLPGWNAIDNKKIEKKFHFTDFKRAMAFANEVGDIAEFEGHHPDIFIHDWNKVTVSLSTHAIKGLSENDFIMAEKIDQVIKDSAE